METKQALHVFVNRRKVEMTKEELSGEEFLKVAGFSGNSWDLLRLQGEGDPTGGELIMFSQIIQVKNGQHYRVIPGNRTFGA